MNIAEANAINRLIRAAYLGADDVDERQLRDDAVYLADRAHRTLGAGLTGAEIRKAWPLDGDPDHQSSPPGRTVRIQRTCNGCGTVLRLASEHELDCAQHGRALPDVTSECPRCSRS